MDKKQIPVIGMSCSSCSAHVEKKLQSLKGIKTASVSLPMRSASVDTSFSNGWTTSDS